MPNNEYDKLIFDRDFAQQRLAELLAILDYERLLKLEWHAKKKGFSELADLLSEARKIQKENIKQKRSPSA